MPVTKRSTSSSRHEPAQGRGQHAGAEEEEARDQHRAPADAVGQHAEGERADQHADQTGAEQGAETGARNVQVESDVARDVGQGLHVEAVHQHGRAAQDQHAKPEAPEPGRVDEGDGIDDARHVKARSHRECCG
jgi:hypothetical protein